MATIADAASSLRAAGWENSPEHESCDALRIALVDAFLRDGGGIYSGTLAGDHRNTGRPARRSAYIYRTALGRIVMEILDATGFTLDLFSIGQTDDALPIVQFGGDEALVSAYRLRGHSFNLDK